MQQWEYCSLLYYWDQDIAYIFQRFHNATHNDIPTFPFPEENLHDTIRRRAQEIGRDGWELTSAIVHPLDSSEEWIFKRPLPFP